MTRDSPKFRRAAVGAVCVLALACGQPSEEVDPAAAGDRSAPVSGDEAPGDADREEGPSAGATAETPTSVLRYEVEARSSSRFGFSGETETETVQATYSLDVERRESDGVFSLVIAPELGTVSEGLEWIGGSIPAAWERQYRSNGELIGGQRTPNDGLFDPATGNLFSVSHLVLSLPSFRLEPGEGWERTDRHPTGRMTTSFELVDVTEDVVELESTAVFRPFAPDGAFSWRETIEGSYDRRTRMAIELEIRHEEEVVGTTERNGAPVSISSSTTFEKSLKRISG